MGLWFWIGVAFISWALASFFGKMVAPYFAAPYLVWIPEHHHGGAAPANCLGPARQLDLNYADLGRLGFLWCW